jgi:L-lactate dehydrogenase complex protein LldF
VARRPALYHVFTEIASRALGWAGGRRGRFRTLPLAAGWTEVRDMPAPEGRSFQSLWAQRRKKGDAR